jgi:hypothetical protein
MFNKIIYLENQEVPQLPVQVELDETFLGSRVRPPHERIPRQTKTIFGLFCTFFYLR